ncbi:murein biosynthesis integral membrane protein MurJ [Candidatus Saccharibacteria bacterium]|nr:murein biosynthesis integral membrane protein MurJ [Candidatus Saccharibacteria bacterium]
MKLLKKLELVDWSSPRFATLTIATAYLLSRVFGLVRDRLLAGHFGVGIQTDAYTAAFRIPEFIFNIIAAGSLAVSFIPVYLAVQKRSGKEHAEQLYSTLWNLVIMIALAGSIVAFILTPWLVEHLIAPGFDRSSQELVARLSRIMLATPLLFVLSSLVGAYLQAKKRFIVDSLSGVFYNVGIIIGILFFARLFDNPIYGVAWGVVFGTFIQFLIPTSLTMLLGWRYQAGALKFWDPDVIRVLKITLPRILSTATDQVTLVVQNSLGSFLATGSIASYYFANNLKNVPLGMIGASMSIATFPSLIQAALESKQVMKKVFRRNLEIATIVITVVLSMMLTSVDSLVALIYGLDSQLISRLFVYLIPAVFAYSLLLLVSRAFYALEDTKTPFIVALAVMLLNIVLSFVLSGRLEVAGLALAISISGVAQLGILLWLLSHKINLDPRDIWTSIVVNGIYLFGILLIPSSFEFGQGLIAELIGLTVNSGVVLIGYLIYAKIVRIEPVNQGLDWGWNKLKNRYGGKN